MVAAAKKLTKDSNGDGNAEVYGLGIEASLIRIAPFVWSAGGELVDDDENPTHFTLDTPEAEVALERFFQLHVTDKVMPGDGGRSRGRRDASRTDAWRWCSRRDVRRRPSERFRSSTGTLLRCPSTRSKAFSTRTRTA